METLKIEPKKKKYKEEEEECPHISFEVIDSGMSFLGDGRRDVGLGCEDCGLEWDIHLYRGSSKATIKLRRLGAEEHDANKDLLKSFIDYLKERDVTICYFDDGRKKRRDTATKGHYPISYDEDSIDRRLDLFFEELERQSLCR